MSKLITQNDLTGVLNEVLPFGYDDDVIKKVIFNISSVSLTANGTYTDTAIDVSAYIPSGYKLIGVDCKATGSNQVYCYQVGISGVTTAVLQLRNISSAITVTPALTITCIKQEFANVGAKQADYIVEQGTSGIWTYRKWNSGIAECWGRAENNSIPSGWSTTGVNLALPFTFKTMKNWQIQHQNYQVSNCYGYPTTISNTYDNINIQTNASAAMSTATFMILCQGTWK